MLALATDTPDFMRARNATDILSQVGATPPPRLLPVATAERSRAAFCSLDQVQAQCRDGQSHLHHCDRHPRHPPRPADEEHRQPGSSTPPQATGNVFFWPGLHSLLWSNRKGTKKTLRRPCLTTYQCWTLQRCSGSARTRRTSAL